MRPRMAPAIEEAILIHRDGTFLGRYPLATTGEIDWSVKAPGLIRAMDAMGKSLELAAPELRELRFEDVTVRFTVGKALILVSVVRGRVRRPLAEQMQAFVGDLEAAYGSVLAGWDGDPSGFRGVDAHLKRLVTSS